MVAGAMRQEQDAAQQAGAGQEIERIDRLTSADSESL